MVLIAFLVDKKFRTELDELSKREERTISQLCRLALRQYLERKNE